MFPIDKGKTEVIRFVYSLLYLTFFVFFFFCLVTKIIVCFLKVYFPPTVISTLFMFPKVP